MFESARALVRRYGRIVRFVIAGSTGAIVNLVALFTIVHFFGVYPVYASMLAFMCAFFVSFTLQKLWTYKNYATKQAGSQLVLYFGIQVVNLSINGTLMYLFIEYTPLHYLIAQVVTSSVIAIESFFVYKHVIFIEDGTPPA